MKENINDIIRNKISKKFYSKNSEEFDQKIDELMGKERVIKQANDNGIKSIPENVMKAIK